MSLFFSTSEVFSSTPPSFFHSSEASKENLFAGALALGAGLGASALGALGALGASSAAAAATEVGA